MFGSEDFGAGAPAAMIAEDQVARVEVAVRSDPDLVADDDAAVEPAVDDDALADRAAASELEPLAMADRDVRADTESMAAFLDEGAQARRPQQPIDIGVIAAEAAEHGQELVAGASLPEGGRKLPLERRIGRHGLPAENGG